MLALLLVGHNTTLFGKKDDTPMPVKAAFYVNQRADCHVKVG